MTYIFQHAAKHRHVHKEDYKVENKLEYSFL